MSIARLPSPVLAFKASIS